MVKFIKTLFSKFFKLKSSKQKIRHIHIKIHDMNMHIHNFAESSSEFLDKWTKDNKPRWERNVTRGLFYKSFNVKRDQL